MAVWNVVLWGADVSCYLFVVDEDLFVSDRLQGVEILFHLAELPFLGSLGHERADSACWHNLKRTYPAIERLHWQKFKTLPGATKSMKENQLYISEEGR